MNLHTPSVPLFIVSPVLAALALIGHFVLLPFVNALWFFWVAIIAYVILAAGIVMKT